MREDRVLIEKLLREQYPDEELTAWQLRVLSDVFDPQFTTEPPRKSTRSRKEARMDKKLLVLIALILGVIAGVIVWFAHDKPTKASELLR